MKSIVAVAFVAFMALASEASATIYWTGDGSVRRVNLDGSYPELAFIPAVTGPSKNEGYAVCAGVAVDASHVFWADSLNDHIARANLDGTDPDHTFIAGADNPCGIAIDNTHIYWTNYGYHAHTTTIGRANLDGSDADQGFIEVTDPSPCGIAVSDSSIYWTSSGGELISRATIVNGSVASVTPKFIEGIEGACGIAVTDSHIYWTSYEGDLGRANLDGTEVTPDFIGGLDRPCGVAVYNGRLYWTEQPNGPAPEVGSAKISTANLDGSAVNRNLLTKFEYFICGLAVDSLAYVPNAPARPLPPSRFNFGQLRHDRHRWAAFISIKARAAGAIRVSATRGVRWSFVPEGTTTASLTNGGRKWLRLWPAARGRAGHRLRQRIKRRGKASIVIHVRYTQAGHSTTVGGKRLSLMRVMR